MCSNIWGVDRHASASVRYIRVRSGIRASRAVRGLLQHKTGWILAVAGILQQNLFRICWISSAKPLSAAYWIWKTSTSHMTTSLAMLHDLWGPPGLGLKQGSIWACNECSKVCWDGSFGSGDLMFAHEFFPCGCNMHSTSWHIIANGCKWAMRLKAAQKKQMWLWVSCAGTSSWTTSCCPELSDIAISQRNQRRHTQDTRHTGFHEVLVTTTEWNT